MKSGGVGTLLPKVEITTTEIYADTVDMGVIGEGQTLSYSFAFVNNTAEPLSVVKCDTGCGCVTVEYERKPIGVEGGAECNLEIHTAGRMGDWNHRVEFELSNGAEYDLVFRMRVK